MKATGIAPRGCVGHLSVQAYTRDDKFETLHTRPAYFQCRPLECLPLRTRRGVGSAWCRLLGRRARTLG